MLISPPRLLAALAAVLLNAATAQAFDPFALDLDAATGASPPPATVIDAGNVAQYQAIVDENLAQLIADGALTITVRAPYSIEIRPEFVEATRAHAGEARLGEAPGVLEGYVAGLPFPEEPSLEDPRAGDKIAWNVRYMWGGDQGELPHFYWQYRDMARERIERELSFYAAQIRLMHRLVLDPKPEYPNNPSKIFNALYLRVIEPLDLRDTQLLVHRLEDDTERDATWLYVASHRRVRRLASGQTTDAFLGSDIMIEDFIGYNGRIMDMKWSYHGTRLVLLPFFDHGEAALVERQPVTGDFRFVDFHGRGGCFPNVPWQVRTAYIVEAVPVWDQHPLSKRRYYIDAQTWTIAYGNLYDRAERLWKVGYGAFAHPDRHLPANKGLGFPLIDAGTQVDIQARHCTTLQFEVMPHHGDLNANDFNVQALRAKGR